MSELESNYTRLRDEAAKHYWYHSDMPRSRTDKEFFAFQAGSDFGKSFSDKQHEANKTRILSKEYCGSKEHSVGCHELFYSEEQIYRCLDCCIEMHKHCLRKHCAQTDCKDKKLLAQDKIISVIEEALSWDVGDSRGPYRNKAIEALTALKEYKNANK